MRCLRLSYAVLLACACVPAFSQSCNTATRAVTLILDASGSMHARRPGGESRIAAAQKAVKGVAASVNPEAQLGMQRAGFKPYTAGK